MKLRDYISLVSGILLVGCIIGMVATFKTNNALCARFYIWGFVTGFVFCISAFRMDYGGRHRRISSNKGKKIIMTITEVKDNEDCKNMGEIC